MDTDLFGEAIVENPRPIIRRGGGWKGGYAAMPGSGPAGETCRTCVNRVHASGGSRNYQKCLLMKFAGGRQFWTSGPGSDIKAKTPACRHWSPLMDAKVDL